MPVVDGLEHRRQVVDDPPDELVTVGERVGERGRVAHQAADGAALALEDLDEVEGELVDLARGQRLEQRLEAVEELGEVQRRGRARGRDGASVGEPRRARRALLQRHVAVADQVEEPDRGLGRPGEGDVILDREGDLGRVAVLELDALDRADGDSGDPDVVTLLDQAGRGEVGLVLGLAAEGERAHDRGQRAGDDDADQDEDAELDRGQGGRGVPGAHWGLPPLVESSSVPFLKLTGGVSGCSGYGRPVALRTVALLTVDRTIPLVVGPPLVGCQVHALPHLAVAEDLVEPSGVARRALDQAGELRASRCPAGAGAAWRPRPSGRCWPRSSSARVSTSCRGRSCRR